MYILAMIKKINNFFEFIIKRALILIMLVLIISTFLQVFTRYVLNNPLVWTEEVTTFAFIWMVFLGASVGVRKCEHFIVDIIFQLIPEKLHKSIILLGHAGVLTIALILLFAGYGFSMMGLTNVSSTLRLSMFYMYSSVFLAGLFMALFSLENIFKVIISKEVTLPGSTDLDDSNINL